MDFPTFLVANVIVDLEPFLVLLLGLDYPLHGFFHSFIGGTIVAFILAFTMSRLSAVVQGVMKLFQLEQKPSLKTMMAASVLGVYSHILLDSPLYTDIRPFYPLDLNPFFDIDVFLGISVHMFCIFCLVAGTLIYIARLVAQLTKKQASPNLHYLCPSSAAF